MVNAAATSAGRDDARAAERALVVRYAPADRRDALEALLALDARLGDILRSTREPLVGQMRLTWWHDALATLDERGAPAEPVLEALARTVLPLGVDGRSLATLVDGWEALLDGDPRRGVDRDLYAERRGGRLFTLAATVLGARDERTAVVGEGWALADLAGNLSDEEARRDAGAEGLERLAALRGGAWPRSLRPLAALGLLARSDLRGEVPGAPRRVTRLLAMRLTGR